MNIDGTNTLACTQAMNEIEGSVRIYPLPHMAGGQRFGAGPLHLLRSIRLDRALAAGSADAAEGKEAEPGGPAETGRPVRAHPVRLLHDSLPEHWWNSARYLGPAALLQAQRWIGDLHVQPNGERLDNHEDPILSLPYDHELHQRLPQASQSGEGHRRDQAHAGRAAGVTVIRDCHLV